MCKHCQLSQHVLQELLPLYFLLATNSFSIPVLVLLDFAIEGPADFPFCDDVVSNATVVL